MGRGEAGGGGGAIGVRGGGAHTLTPRTHTHRRDNVYMYYATIIQPIERISIEVADRHNVRKSSSSYVCTYVRRFTTVG